MSQLTATQPTAQKSGNIVRLSNDFLQSPGNQYYKAVITVIKVVLEAAGFDTRIEYNVVPLSTFATHTYVYAKKFTATQFMRPLMEALNKAGIKADIPEPEPNKRRFRVSLNIPLALAENYFEAGMYKVAVAMSPVYENPTPVNPGANGHSHSPASQNGHAVSLTTKSAVSTTDAKVTSDTDVVSLVKELTVKNKLAVPGMSTGRVAQADAASILVSVMVSADKLTLARQVFGGAHLQWKEYETKESMKGAIIFRFFNGPWKTTAPAATAPKKVVETPLARPAVASPSEPSPSPSPAVHIDESAEDVEEVRTEDVELDEEVKDQLVVRHPQSILTATVQRKKQYLTEVVKNHGHGLKLEWVRVPEGEEEKGWRVRESSDQRRNMDLFDLLQLWGYYVSPGPAKPGTEGMHSYQYFLIKRLEPWKRRSSSMMEKSRVARKWRTCVTGLCPRQI